MCGRRIDRWIDLAFFLKVGKVETTLPYLTGKIGLFHCSIVVGALEGWRDGGMEEEVVVVGLQCLSRWLPLNRGEYVVGGAGCGCFLFFGFWMHWLVGVPLSSIT